jgi:hypothetical protein
MVTLLFLSLGVHSAKAYMTARDFRVPDLGGRGDRAAKGIYIATDEAKAEWSRAIYATHV